ncbi:Translation initiation factor IF3-2, chloroplastic, partial [Cucurbita argyrosperma subsp. argyrosperma]
MTSKINNQPVKPRVMRGFCSLRFAAISEIILHTFLFSISTFWLLLLLHSYKIDQHDYSVRLRAAKKFLQDGDKVKVIVNLKGRENEFRKIAIELVKRFQEELGELATEEAKNFRDRNVFIVLAPNKAVLQKSQEPPKKKDKPAAVNEVSARVEVSEASSLSQK